MEERRVRISDIAEELGLSTATVSNVIHGKKGKVSDETVKAVQALLEKKKYIPSMAGILLAQNSSKIIGVFINDHEKYEGHTLDDAFIASSLNCLSEEIEKEDRFMMIKKAKNSEEIIKFASMWNMDGLIIIGFCHQDYMYLRNHIRIPFVVYDGFCENPERIVNISFDNFDGGNKVGKLFKDFGHKKAICISDNNTGVDRERIEGFLNGFGNCSEHLIIPMNKARRWDFYKTKLDLFKNISAVFAVSDYYAVDLIHFLNESGFSVPNDISVAGFDDISLCELISPTLTTVRQDGALRAKIALKKLSELKENKIGENEVVLPVELIVRESVIRI